MIDIYKYWEKDFIWKLTDIMFSKRFFFCLELDYREM